MVAKIEKSGALAGIFSEIKVLSVLI